MATWKGSTLAALGVAVTASLVASCNRSPQPSAPAPGSASEPTAPAFSVRVVGQGPPMLLIPGLASPGSVWDSTVERYRDRYTLHVFTLAGFGGQPRRPGLTLDQVRADLVRYIAEQKLEKPVVVGHSLGGFMTCWLGATAPDSVGPLVSVDGLPFLPALFDPDATAESARPQAERFRASFQAMNHQQFLAGLRSGLAIQATGQENQDRVLSWCSPSDPAAVGSAMAELMSTDLRPRCKDIRSPLLLIGAVGGVPPTMQEAVRAIYQAQVASIPDHQVVFLEHARHFVMLDDPAGFFAALDAFLRRTGR